MIAPSENLCEKYNIVHKNATITKWKKLSLGDVDT